jgi:hypothetical protein
MAVTMIIGTCEHSRIFWQVAKPSIWGSITSSGTSDGVKFGNISSASYPEKA